MSDYVLFFFFFFLPFTFFILSCPWLWPPPYTGVGRKRAFGTTLWEGKRLAFCFLALQRSAFQGA